MKPISFYFIIMLQLVVRGLELSESCLVSFWCLLASRWSHYMLKLVYVYSERPYQLGTTILQRTPFTLCFLFANMQMSFVWWNLNYQHKINTITQENDVKNVLRWLWWLCYSQELLGDGRACMYLSRGCACVYKVTHVFVLNRIKYKTCCHRMLVDELNFYVIWVIYID